MSFSDYTTGSWFKPLLILVLGIGCIIVFETFQQNFYINRFNLATEEIALIDLLLAHIRRWAVWMVTGIPLVLYTYKYPLDVENSPYRQLFKLAVMVLTALFFCIAIITTLEWLILQEAIFTEVFGSNFTFFLFQKGPIYLMAYVGLIVLVHLFLKSRALAITTGELYMLKDKNQALYKKLKSQAYDDHEKFIQVKVGKKIKVVPIGEIQWVEADDYCVKLHTRTYGPYVLRSSMKSMEKVLPVNEFIRIHRQSIVNLNDVEEFLFNETPAVRLVNGQELPVAQSRVSLIRQKLNFN